MFRTRQIGQGVCWTESDMFSFEEAVTHPDGKGGAGTGGWANGLSAAAS